MGQTLYTMADAVRSVNRECRRAGYRAVRRMHLRPGQRLLRVDVEGIYDAPDRSRILTHGLNPTDWRHAKPVTVLRREKGFVYFRYDDGTETFTGVEDAMRYGPARLFNRTRMYQLPS